jgi:hypothetical protein
VITLELWIWLLVDIYIIVSEYLGCVVITENVVFQHVYGEEHGRAAKAPDTVIFDPTVPVLELFWPVIDCQEFTRHISSQIRR